jgi:hypothetical protein
MTIKSKICSNKYKPVEILKGAEGAWVILFLSNWLLSSDEYEEADIGR